MILAVDIGTVLGSIGTLIAAVVAALALLQNRRTESKTATREEVQQAFELQDLAMKELEASNLRLIAEINRVRGKNDAQHDTLNTTFAKMAELKAEHNKCQRDLNALGRELRRTTGELREAQGELRDVHNQLKVAQAQIAELGG